LIDSAENMVFRRRIEKQRFTKNIAKLEETALAHISSEPPLQKYWH